MTFQGLCSGFRVRLAQERWRVSCVAFPRRGSNLVSLEVKFHSEKLQEQFCSKLFELLACTQMAELTPPNCAVAKL